MGRPKALVTDAAGMLWVVRAARSLADGGCAPVIVVIGAEADAVRTALTGATGPAGATAQTVLASDWAEGMSASLRAGLHAAEATAATAAMIHVVDVPDVGAEVVRRLARHASPDVLARAGYGAHTHGHPVLVGRDHWAGIRAESVGDAGARAYLARHDVRTVECGDLATGADLDHPDDLPHGVALPRLGA